MVFFICSTNFAFGQWVADGFLVAINDILFESWADSFVLLQLSAIQRTEIFNNLSSKMHAKKLIENILDPLCRMKSCLIVNVNEYVLRSTGKFLPFH